MSTDTPSSPDAADGRRALVLVGALYVAWTAATYLLEGRLCTLLRPDATMARLAYAVVANLLIGCIGTIGVLRWSNRRGFVGPEAAGFRGLRHSLGSVGAGLTLGGIIYAFQSTPIWHPGVLVNGFAQVLVVSTAEVLVCWVAVGSLSHRLLQRFGGRIAFSGAAIIASALFGVYHFAHSPPFNTWDMVLLLSGVGLGTSTFFFVTRNVYGTIAFHNMLGLYGVTQSLAGHDRLAQFETLQPPLLIMAGVTVALLVAADRYGLRRS